MLLLMQFSTHAQLGLQKRHGVNRVIILFTQQLHYLWYFFSIIGHSVLLVLIFYYKEMLGKVTWQRTQQFSAFLFLPKEPSSM